MELVVSIRDVGGTDLPLVGGKGANLGELTRAGLPVPIAICVTTEAYRQFIALDDLQAPILAELVDCDFDDVTDLVLQRSARIRERMITASVPPGVDAAIREGYAGLEERLGADLEVSVRSSATAKICPACRSPVSRTPISTSMASMQC